MFMHWYYQQNCYIQCASRSNNLKNSNDWLESTKSDTTSDPFIYYRPMSWSSHQFNKMICFLATAKQVSKRKRTKSADNDANATQLEGNKMGKRVSEWVSERNISAAESRKFVHSHSYQCLIKPHWYFVQVSLVNVRTKCLTILTKLVGVYNTASNFQRRLRLCINTVYTAQ